MRSSQTLRMNIFETAKNILNKICVDNLPFAVALKSTFKTNNVDHSIKSNINALVGCELRHHLIFGNLINRFLGEVEFEDTIYLRFLLANKLFLKRFSDKEIKELISPCLDKNNVEELLKFVSSTNELIANNLDKSSPEFLSYRFNCPAWIIRMWQKQYGKGLVFKILKANYHQALPSLRVDTRYTTADEVVGKNPDFAKAIISDMVVFQGRGNLKAIPEYSNGHIFFMKMATKYILDRLPIEPFKKMVIYSDVPNNIYLDLLVRLNEGLNLDLVINNSPSYYETKRIIEEKNIKGIDVYNTNAKNLITCISSPVDLIICLPASSAFDLLRSTPDYFIRAKQEKLDSLILDDAVALNEAAGCLNNGGTIAYMVPTLNKKESINIIGDFLSTHPDFELLEEKQFFPFESYDSCLYFAILKKSGDQND